MKREKLEELLRKLEKELEVFEKRYSQSKADADKLSREAVASWSSGGDREYSQNQAEILKENLESIKKTKEFIEKALQEEFEEIVKVPSYVEIELGGNKLEFFLVDYPVHLKDVLFLSSDSEIGKIIFGKKVGEKFEIKRDGKVLQGSVVGIE